MVFLTQKEDPTRANRGTDSGRSAGSRGWHDGVDVCRRVGIGEQTFYAWKRKYAGLGLSELRGLRQLCEKNAKLKRLVQISRSIARCCRRSCEKSCTASGPACAGTLGANGLRVSAPGLDAVADGASLLTASESQ